MTPKRMKTSLARIVTKKSTHSLHPEFSLDVARRRVENKSLKVVIGTAWYCLAGLTLPAEGVKLSSPD